MSDILSSETDSEPSLEGHEEEEDIIGLYIGGRNANGERHKRGFAILPNGDQFDGQYRRGRRHGHGLYVFKNGERYLGNYRCGIRSGLGKFIYFNGSIYDGNWRKGLKHGKGIYTYANGDIYEGDWFKGKRHGVGIYTFKDSCICFNSTWQKGIHVGPGEAHYGNLTLHGYWDYMYPQGPAVFNYKEKYILRGYFKSEANSKEDNMKFIDEMEEDYDIDDKSKTYSFKVSRWYSQAIELYDFSKLPREPVPIPVSDSELSYCSLITVESKPEEEAVVICEEEECLEESVKDITENCSEYTCDFDDQTEV